MEDLDERRRIRNKIIEIGPMQFDFSNWEGNVAPYLSNGKVMYALYLLLCEDHEYIAEIAGAEEGEIKLCMIRACASFRSLEWLRNWSDNHFLEGVMKALAEAIYPEQKWLIIESPDHAVVTNHERTMVFDVMMHDKLSGIQALVLAGDPLLGGKGIISIGELDDVSQ